MENKEVLEESGISLGDIYKIIKKRFLFLVIITLLGGLIVGGYAFFIATPKYQSTGAIMIQVHTEGSNAVNTVESQRLVQTTVDMLTKIDLIPKLTSENLKTMGYDVSMNEIRDNIGVSNSAGSLLIIISFISTEEELAEITLQTIIDTLIEVTESETYNMDKTLKGNISDFNVSPARYYSPNKILYTLVGILLGGTLGLVLVFAYEMINTGFKTKEEVEHELQVQVLGEIPEFKIK